MNTGGKIIFWLKRGVLVFAILVIAGLIIAPRLTNLETVRKNIEETFTREVGGDIKYRQMELAYLPRPHVVIHKTELMIPKSFTIKIHLLKIYPKIFPLLKGRFQAAIVKIEYADYFLKLPEFSAGAKKPEKLLAVDDVVKNLVSAVRSLPEFKLPQLNLRIKHGKGDLVDPFGEKFKFRELTAKYERSSNKFEFSIACKSNFWQSIKIDGSLNLLDSRGQSQIQPGFQARPGRTAGRCPGVPPT